MARFGFNGKILKADLGTGTLKTEEPDDLFYRKYLGGSALGVYYCLKEMPAGTDALAPESVLVFAPSVLTGAPVSGASRFTVTCRSPLGGTIGDSQSGGKWGPALKFAGFDAVVITGRSPEPVYLLIDDGEAELRDARDAWGLPTAETRKSISSELEDENIEIACIGPGGEKLVRFACISGGGSDYAGRTGTGAVMGSKNLKAIACRGKRSYEFADRKGMQALARRGAERVKQGGLAGLLKEYGTAGVVNPQYNGGNFAARNFTHGSFQGKDKLCGENFAATLVKKSETCYACAVGCKKVVEAQEPYPIAPEYGGPEFETIVMMGSNLLIDDPAAVSKANELCNAYGIDTISTGAMIAYATECFEKGLIDAETTGGVELGFGDPGAMIEMVKMIGEREGFGDILAEGPEHAVERLGSKTAKYAIHVKGLPLPAHMAQVKRGLALAYSVNPFGADHMSSEHDWLITAPVAAAHELGLYETREPATLDLEKVRMTAYTQMFYSLLDTLTLCAFCWGPDAIFSYSELEELVETVTGWKMSLWELMKTGERRVNMMRAFNAREGFTYRDDVLPERVFTPVPEGIAEGACVPREDFEKALKTYYSLMCWDPGTGNPTAGKLAELGLEWITQGITSGD